MKKCTMIKVTMIGPSVMSKKHHIDQSLQDTVNVGASNTAKGKGKAASKTKTSNLDLATSSVVFYVLTNITSYIIFFVALLLATPS